MREDYLIALIDHEVSWPFILTIICGHERSSSHLIPSHSSAGSCYPK